MDEIVDFEKIIMIDDHYGIELMVLIGVKWR